MTQPSPTVLLTLAAATAMVIAVGVACDDKALEKGPATDASGARQPLEQVRNDLGYENNAAQPVVVRVE